ncbi:MAG: NAD(P)/FAD-dependent oxidoreductase [Candidatus Altiarchaeota archaeon]|nr:NAD(P)/FAD-dependent oxidoreductase [Candidatus Altiarchaeota archaeon]
MAKAGLNPVVHETHEKIGYPEHCTGLVSNNIDALVEPEVVLHYINGAKFFCGKKEAVITKKKVAKVIDRAAFDLQLYDLAVSNGAKVKLNSKVNHKDFSKNIIAADGAFGQTRSDFNQKLGFLPAMQYDLNEKPQSDMVELWFEPWNPDFFIWVVPRGNRVRVGTASKNLLPLKSFIQKRFGRIRTHKKYAGLVVTSGPVKKTQFKSDKSQVFLVGDSAGQVKPTTGGGLVTGLTCANILSNVIIDQQPETYEASWRQTLGKELKLQKLARWMMIRNPSGFIDFITKNRAGLESYGDMDYQTRQLKKFLPSLPKLILGALFGSKTNK